MLNCLLLYKEHEFMELVCIAATSVLIHKFGIKFTASKDIDIKVLLDLGIEIPIILPYFIKKYTLTIIEGKK
jgi:hypothetical protein